MKPDRPDRPLIVFDVEATGVDPAKDRIVSLAALRMCELEDPQPQTMSLIFNPQVEMSEDVIAIHGISNLTASIHGTFVDGAVQVYSFFAGCDLAGFNLINFDVPILYEEFARAGIEWDLDGVRILDAGNIFKKKEQRTLAAAVKFYCGGEHTGAHNADADVMATLAVLKAQLKRYPDLGEMTVEQLAEFSRFDNRVDLAGKIIRNAQGEPVYNIGKSKGVRVVDDWGFGYWMLDKDFTSETKSVIRRILAPPIN
jgi:DNA polymerase-3 subunit epsilon